MYALIAALLLSASAPAQPDCRTVRRDALVDADKDRAAGDLAKVSAALRKIVDAGCGRTDVYLLLARFAAEMQNPEEEAKWLGAVIRDTPDVNASEMNLHFIRARAFHRMGCADEAREEAKRGLTHPTVSMLMSFDDPIRTWEAHRPEIAEVLLEIANTFPEGDAYRAELRKVAAMLLLKYGFHASYYVSHQQTIEGLSAADRAMPLEELPTQVQMTAWQVLAVAHASLQELPHATAAVEQLYALCYPPGAPDPCPWFGVIDVNLERPNLEALRLYDALLRSVGFEFDQLPTSTVDGENLRVLAYLLHSAYDSISWEGGRRRPAARDDDFFGFQTSDGPYAGDVSPEEDRTEARSVWINYMAGNNPEFPAEVFRRAAEHSEPLVKIYLTELFTDPMRSALNTRPLIASGTFLGVPFADIESRLEMRRAEGKIPDPTWAAFEVGRAAHRLLRTLYERRTPAADGE